MAKREISCRALLAPVFLLGFSSLCFAQYSYPTNVDPQQQQVQAQQQDNRNWQNAAVQLEAQLVNAGNQAYQAKDFATAADDYQRALNITYDQWDIRSLSAGGTQLLQPAERRIQKTLATQNTQTARARLKAIPGAAAAEDEATAQKDIRTLFEQADVAMMAKNVPEAYQAYEDIISIASAQGEKRFAIESANKARDAEKKILAEAGKPLDEVQKTIAAGKAEDALAKLDAYKKGYAALLAVAPDLKNRVDALQASPDIKKQLQGQEVQRLIQVGDLAVLREDYAIAARYYRKAAMLYPGTAAAGAAAEKLAKLQANPKAAEALKPDAAGGK